MPNPLRRMNKKPTRAKTKISNFHASNVVFMQEKEKNFAMIKHENLYNSHWSSISTHYKHSSNRCYFRVAINNLANRSMHNQIILAWLKSSSLNKLWNVNASASFSSSSLFFSFSFFFLFSFTLVLPRLVWQSSSLSELYEFSSSW